MSNSNTTAFVPKFATHLCCGLALLVSATATANGQTVLGTAQQFGVLGAASVSNAGATTIDRSLGVSSNVAISGLSGITLGGALHVGDPVAVQAQSDARTAYDALRLLPFTTDLTGQDLGGMTLLPGVYFFSSTAQLTGNLFLDFLGNAGSQFVFQIGSALTTATSSTVAPLHGGPFADVFWLVGSSATLGTTSTLLGNVIAEQSITLTTGARIDCGRAIALGADLSMDTNVISDDCASTAVPVTPTPEPATFGLFAIGALVMTLIGAVRGGSVRRSRSVVETTA